MNEKQIILEAMKKAGEPLNAGKVAELTGLDRKVVDKAFCRNEKGRFHRFSREMQVGTRRKVTDRAVSYTEAARLLSISYGGFFK